MTKEWKGLPSPRASQQKALKQFEIAKVQRFSAETTQCGGDQEFDDAMNEARSCIAAKLSYRNHTVGRLFFWKRFAIRDDMAESVEV
ncbi:hypothetical protein CEXT_638991 [Caerostris extrusa]|uniref:Uncharacterized protein n=1 Tax=Caerostris extrusa TaxID=172846 RepID=A0AAV4R515_CAEEX|nr:hypothetical protein CEXT_638991 [Caerostris extrusa]